ncbi:MAG: helicase [Rhodobiaceae bacterium]|nr:helicase [Rhodobiaceae bacterium]MCC0051831.1 helicase [Rhodobiaceae bacterium]
MGSHSYGEFLARKAIIDPPTGIDGKVDLPKAMMPHQRDITEWALRRGRAAIFAGTGLGKTFMELAWADRVAGFTGKPVLIFAPLAVSAQHIREAAKFGLDAAICAGQPDVSNLPVIVTNYQKMDRFDLSQFGGVVLDESSILKSSDGKYRSRLIEECRQVPFRLAATATPAPNDFMELGNHAEFLGVMSQTDMLAMFFTHDGGETQKWRLKGHAEDAFWRWMASWSVMLRKPSDLGYPNDGYDLPDMIQQQHAVQVEYAPCMEAGTLFPMEARTMGERLAARRDSVADRVALAASITPADRPFVWWCNLNAESEAIAKAIPGAVEVRGSDKDEDKERKLVDFSEGRIRVLVTKPSIAGFGMNWQHCADTGFVGLSDSFEQVYQAIRRFWRFGQTKPVNVHFISAETEGAVVANIRRKEADAERMADAMVKHMADLSSANVRGMVRDRADYSPAIEMRLPAFLADP